MTDTGDTSTLPSSRLASRYGTPAARFRVAYPAQGGTSRREDDLTVELAMSDSRPPAQEVSLPTIPAGSVVTPPAAGKTIDLEAAFVGRGELRADLTVVKPKQPTIKPSDHIAQYRIAGEMFYVEVRGRRTYLRHPLWSLMGSGKTLAIAEVALLEEAGLVARVFGRMAPDELDEEAERMLNFARRIA